MYVLFDWLRITGYCETVALEYVFIYYASVLVGELVVECSLVISHSDV
jgi:hypothetical protein